MNTKIALHINEIIKETPDAISICFAQPEQHLAIVPDSF